MSGNLCFGTLEFGKHFGNINRVCQTSGTKLSVRSDLGKAGRSPSNVIEKSRRNANPLGIMRSFSYAISKHF